MKSCCDRCKVDCRQGRDCPHRHSKKLQAVDFVISLLFAVLVPYLLALVTGVIK